jgi:hypothetical protein
LASKYYWEIPRSRYKLGTFTLNRHNHNNPISIILMVQMILSKPSIIIIRTYQDMMEWMSRILDGEMAGADEDFGSSWANVAGFCPKPKPQIHSASSSWAR